jgi:hypothetical protein
MHKTIVDAVGRTFGFAEWLFGNEFEFKHELFHQLAIADETGASLAEKVEGTTSCRLHCEGRAECGTPLKTDLLICDPRKIKPFNYAVEYLIELKQSLTPTVVANELAKLKSYRDRHTYSGLYLIAFRPPSGECSRTAQDCHVLHPLNVPITRQANRPENSASLTLEEAVVIVSSAIHESLSLYGNSRKQYHSHFWCNYEHEIHRRHSFPCEGDFNAQIYHRLRKRLPPGVEIRSEVYPSTKSRQRIDFVVRDHLNQWAIPIDIKMNWDQFKPKFANGRPKQPESELIIDRLQQIVDDVGMSYPFLVVIQFDWQSGRNIRTTALPLLQRCTYPLELVGFSEVQNTIVRLPCGPAPMAVRLPT